MKLSRNIALSCEILAAHKLRTLLSVTGIVVGIATVVLMVSAGRGAEKKILDRIRDMGTNLIVVNAGQTRIVAGRQRQTSMVTTLETDDAQAIAAECASVKLAAPAVTQEALDSLGGRERQYERHRHHARGVPHPQHRHRRGPDVRCRGGPRPPPRGGPGAYGRGEPVWPGRSGGPPDPHRPRPVRGDRTDRIERDGRQRRGPGRPDPRAPGLGDAAAVQRRSHRHDLRPSRERRSTRPGRGRNPPTPPPAAPLARQAGRLHDPEPGHAAGGRAARRPSR